jgi:hypothetical protein
MMTTDPIKLTARRFEEMKAHKLHREAEFQLIADHFLPRKDFSCVRRQGELRRRRLTSSVPAVSLRNSAAMLYSYLIDPTQPFIRPNAEGALVAAGRSARLGVQASDWLDNMAWGIHERMMRPKSGFLTSSARVAIELWAFGTGIQWIGRKRGFGPVYQARPLRSCWIATNGDGVVDTVYFEFELPLWRVFEMFPDARYVDKWVEKAKTDAGQNERVTILHTVEPRRDGIKGGPKERKPFAERYICLDAKAILSEDGYDSFPYAVPRLEVEDGSDYGTGRCWYALPDAMGLSILQQGIENAVDLKVAPPVMMPKKMFGKPLDRRPGATNLYDSAGLGFMAAREAFQTLDIAGDVGVGLTYHDRLIQNVESAMLVDWLRLRDSGNVTAEEIIERRNLRVGIMSAHVPGIDRDWMGVAADRTAEIMVAEGDLGPPPRELSGATVEWDYAGPLARAQQQRQAEAFDRMFQRAIAARELDPAAPFVLNVAEGLRACAEAEGLPIGTLRGREDVEALTQAQAEQAQAQAEAEMQLKQAQALQAGGQGAMNVSRAAQQGAEAPANDMAAAA